MTLDELNSRFVYKTDMEKHGVFEDWTIPKIEADGKIYGDCDDYLLCVIYYCKIFVKIHFAKHIHTGEGHVIGEYNNQYIDNNTREFRNQPLSVFKITRRVYYIEALLRMLLSKLKIYKLIGRLKK